VTASGYVVARVTPYVFRAPIEKPVVNAFGTMTNRPMALVAIEDRDGAVGWGEIWANFPVVGAEHRARLVASVFTPLLVGKTVASPPDTYAQLARTIASQVLQTGESGPFSQCLAAIDQALTDLAARRAGVPLWRYLGGSDPDVRVYASGLGPDGAEALACVHWDLGFRAFKLKVGFGRERDLANLRALRGALPAGATIMIDANQAWSPEDAHAMLYVLREHDLAWAEEPIAADQPFSTWQSLARAAAPLRLAAGENLCSRALLDDAIASQAFGVLQPDIGKWGGFSEGLPIARRAAAAGLWHCPHWLAGGVGLAASLHLRAACGGEGLTEWDANPNPLREIVPLPPVRNGRVTLTDAPGLGFVPDLGALAQYAVPC
jgi:L-alanine-DL-glutamate epimerase-like enolase superfamily enzyme